MVRKFVVATVIFLGMSKYGAQIQEDNRFNNTSETESLPQDRENQTNAGPSPGGPGDDPDPVPIDDYIPVLILTAAGIIIAVHRRKIAFKK